VRWHLRVLRIPRTNGRRALRQAFDLFLAGPSRLPSPNHDRTARSASAIAPSGCALFGVFAAQIIGQDRFEAASDVRQTVHRERERRPRVYETMRPLRYANSVVPHIYVRGAAQAVTFYAEAFGARELLRITAPDGRIVHSELSVCGATVMLGDPGGRLYDEPRLLGACTASLHLMVDDNAAVLVQAVAAGCEQVQPPTEMFYGASSASVRDPFGHIWVLLTWKEDLCPAEMERRGKAALADMDAKAQ
jgi:PhnB protein